MMPGLESLIVLQGEPVWQDLLGAAGQFVQGGKELRVTPKDLNLVVRKEESDLTLSVWREGHETVREVKVEFPEAITSSASVNLEIRMTPGQGNPRVEVKPDDSRVFGGRRVYLDWRRTDDSGRTRQQARSGPRY